MLPNPLLAGLSSSLMAGLLVASRFLVSPVAQSSPAAQADSPQSSPAAVEQDVTSSEGGLRLFREQVRPLLAGKCVECHNPDRREGGLDLTRRATALAGGDSGPGLVPGQPQQSLLYQLVTAGEMPPDLKLLLPAEIAALEEWIELGAPYVAEPLMPSSHAGSSAAPPGPFPMCPCMRMMQESMAAGSVQALSPSTLPLSQPLTKDAAGLRAEHYLKSLGNPLLKLGRIDETLTAYEAQVVTRDDSLVNWIIVDKKSGRMRLLY
ncbi:MAG: hypothetical protein KY476_19030 [Planctomycetes bacterium]|nr:hypothetical protein [Planctomycetota bacterium]